SDGGKDASVWREWSHRTKSFVEGGFNLPEAKADVAWVDQDTLLVATDWGPGTTTTSGYPFIVKRWRRGEPLAAAAQVIRGAPRHVAVSPVRMDIDGEAVMLAVVAETFFEAATYWLPDPGAGAEASVALPIPKKASLAGWFKGELIFTIQEDWAPEGYPEAF